MGSPFGTWPSGSNDATSTAAVIFSSVQTTSQAKRADESLKGAPEGSLKGAPKDIFKATLRKKMQHTRKLAHRDYLRSSRDQNALCANFSALLEEPTLSSFLSSFLPRSLSRNLSRNSPSDKPPLCAGYFPMHSELDPRPLMRIYAQKYADAGCACCLLPVVVGKREPLLFRLYDGVESRLEAGAFSTHHPPSTANVGEPALLPTLLLVPLLAFDKKCRRLGYGGGFYDRTLSVLRERERDERRGVFALGIAYESQLVASVPSEPHDLALDAVLTERRVYRLTEPL